MTKSKNTKKALLASVLSMLVCVSMLIGSTFAWFTDSVTTGVNKIVAGNLDIELVDKAGKPLTDALSFTNADDETDILWEPGCTYMLPEFRIVNNGNLWLKYKVELSGVTGTAKLLEVIDFYVFEDVVDPATIKAAIADGTATKMTEYFKLDEIQQVDGGIALAPNGEAGDQSALLTVVGHMKESATNEYMDEKLDGVSITVLATQYTKEKDSFDEKYDKDATYQVTTMTDLISAVKKGGNIVLQKDLAWKSGTLTLTKDTVLDLNGNKLGPTNGTAALSVTGGNVTIKNGTVELPKSATEYILLVTGDSDVTVENCTLRTDGARAFAVATNGGESHNSNITLKNTTLYTNQSYTTYFPAGNITMENCDVTGAVVVSGGTLSINGGTFTAAGFDGQWQIWHEADTASYLGKLAGQDGAGHMGDSILLIDRRAGYQALSKVEIKNVTFNTELTLSDGSKAPAYAIKYFDIEGNLDKERVNCVIEGNTYNHKMNGNDPLMFIDKSGNNIFQ